MAAEFIYVVVFGQERRRLGLSLLFRVSLSALKRGLRDGRGFVYCQDDQSVTVGDRCIITVLLPFLTRLCSFSGRQIVADVPIRRWPLFWCAPLCSTPVSWLTQSVEGRCVGVWFSLSQAWCHCWFICLACILCVNWDKVNGCWRNRLDILMAHCCTLPLSLNTRAHTNKPFICRSALLWLCGLVHL